jgi:hypothetical protein
MMIAIHVEYSVLLVFKPSQTNQSRNFQIKSQLQPHHFRYLLHRPMTSTAIGDNNESNLPFCSFLIVVQQEVRLNLLATSEADRNHLHANLPSTFDQS